MCKNKNDVIIYIWKGNFCLSIMPSPNSFVLKCIRLHFVNHPIKALRYTAPHCAMKFNYPRVNIQ